MQNVDDEEKDKDKLMAFKMRCHRRILKVRLFDVIEESQT